MTELIKIESKDGIQTVNARELWEKLESKQEFANWIKNRLDGFTEGYDFILDKAIKVQNEGGREVNRPVVEYHLTIDTAKHVAMLERNEKGREIRQYFIDVEKRARSLVPQSFADALQLAADQAREIEAKNAALQIAAPKAAFYDAVTGSTDTIDIGEAAKVLAIKGLGRNRLFELLREAGVLMGNNQPYQKYVDLGYFRTIESTYTKPDGSTHVNIKTVVYQKGLDFIRKTAQRGTR